MQLPCNFAQKKQADLQHAVLSKTVPSYTAAWAWRLLLSVAPSTHFHLKSKLDRGDLIGFHEMFFWGGGVFLLSPLPSARTP